MPKAQRPSRPGPPPADDAPPDADGHWTLGVFVAALAARLLFWQAMPDAGAGWSALYKGDAPLWLDYARALRDGRPFELGLPFRPPGTAYLASWLWDPAAGLTFLRFAWVVMGAATVAVLYRAMRSAFDATVARVAAVLMAFSTALLVLSASVNAETPYLLLAAVSVWLLEGLRRRPRLGRLVAFSVVQAAACLFRTEHLLFSAGALVILARAWRPADAPAWAGLRGLAPAFGIALLAFAAALLPWQWRAWDAVTRFNTQPPVPTASEQSLFDEIEEPLRDLQWDDAARARRERLPAFARRAAADFVAATVKHRGGTTLRREDFDVLRDAFGYEPEPVARTFFVALYGPLNFALAHHPAATGGFSRAALDAAPPLAGDTGRYPAQMIQGLPPQRLSFVYPPHLRLVNRGYAVGAGWIRERPGAAAARLGAKLARFWSGAALGWTGYGLPLQLSGTRRAVDVVVPDARLTTRAFRVLVFGLCLLGAFVARPREALGSWLLLFVSRLVPALAFFGYARMGATAVPVVALLTASAAVFVFRRAELPLVRREWLLAAALAAGVAVEGVRAARGVEVLVDGQPVLGSEPGEPDLHLDQRVEVRHR